MSLSAESTLNTSGSGKTTNCANVPSHSEPTVQISNGRLSTGVVTIARPMTRSPSRSAETPSPTATIVPQASAPWMRGKDMGTPDQVASELSSSSIPSAAPWSVASVTDFEYQPIRVFTSVLLTPAAWTLTSTSPGPGLGVGMSVRY